MLKNSWWNDIPKNYYQSFYKTELDDQHRLKIGLTATLDHVCRTGLAMSILMAMNKNFASGLHVRKELELLEFYKAFAESDNPADVFVEPPMDVEIKKSKSSGYSHHLKGIAKVDLLHFDSPYITLNPELNAEYSMLSKNNRVVAQHWQHTDGVRQTLIFIHGVVLDSYLLNSKLFELNWLYQQGYDVLLYTLPFHGYRKEPNDLINGLGFFSRGFAHSNEAMVQSVFDLRILMNYLEQNGVTQMGVMGFSLGGYISALVANVDGRLFFVIQFAPVVFPIDMVMGWPPLSTFMQNIMKKHDWNIQVYKKSNSFAPCNQLETSDEPHRLMVVGGAGDRFTAPRFVKLLHEHWQGSEMYWYHGNHLLFFNHGQVLHWIKNFMDRCCEINPY